MKNIMITLLLAVICHDTSSAQKLTADKVPAAVAAAMKTKYPAVTKQTWEMEGKDGYEANFMNGTKKQSATFDKTGKWLETETAIMFPALPKAVAEVVSKQYADFKLQEVSEIESAEKGTFYEVVAAKGKERYEIQYSPKGDVLKKETLKPGQD